MKKIILCDLDGTIKEPASGATFINNPKDQQIIKEAREALAHYNSQG